MEQNFCRSSTGINSGHLFFLIYINDLTTDVKCNVKLFTDDTSIFSIVYNPNECAANLNHDLNLIKCWAYDWRVSFNPDPTKQAVEMTFSKKKIPADHPPLFFNDAPVMKVDEHKHKGVVLDSRLTFSSHIQSAINKARRGTGMLRFLHKYLPRQTLNKLYKLYVVRILIMVMSSITFRRKWANLGMKSLHRQMERLESVQYSDGLAITGAWKGSSRKKIYEELGWESLNDRKWSRRLVLSFKFINKLAPEYTRQPIPQVRRSNYSLRRRAAIGRMSARTEGFESSFYPNCLKEWNSLASEIRESPTVSLFKKRLSSLIRPSQKPTYGILDLKGVAILTQLRVGLSKLNFHKFKHNFQDTVDPMCLINGGIEDTEYFLLRCHAYDDQRRDLLGAINKVFQPQNILNLPNQTLVQILLYGDGKCIQNQNRNILESALKFIHTSERFL